jgi:hypothetical protein
MLQRIFAAGTRRLLRHDLTRLHTYLRRFRGRDETPAFSRLHLGCGTRRLAGWLNVDLTGSDYDVDMCRRFPWRDGVFEAIVSQHVIECFELPGEVHHVLSELHRVLHREGELWLSCPDLEKACRLYVDGRSRDMLADRRRRIPTFDLGGAPPSDIMNDTFYGYGHRAQFDFDLLAWALQKASFRTVERVVEKDLLARFPAFPARGDDLQTLYVVARP